jgi:hypothetical protein
MCSTSTSKEEIIYEPPPRSKESEAYARDLKMAKPFSLKSGYDIPDPTILQVMNKENKMRERNDELKLERDMFFYKLRTEREYKDKLQKTAAVMIQATYRGYLSRKRRRPETIELIFRPEGEVQAIAVNVPRISDIHNELCLWQSALSLKPLHGLTLEPQNAHTRRRARFEFAAALRLQCFFRMLVCKSRIRKLKSMRRAEILLRNALIINKFIKLARKVTAKRKETLQERERATLKIQSRFRIFRSKGWVKKIIKMRQASYRMNDAVIVIQRNCRKLVENRANLSVAQDVSAYSEDYEGGDEKHSEKK